MPNSMPEPDEDEVTRALRELGDEPAEVGDLEAAWPGVVARARAEAERRERASRARRLLIGPLLVAVLVALAMISMKHDAPPAPPPQPTPPPRRPAERAPLPDLTGWTELAALFEAVGATPGQREKIAALAHFVPDSSKADKEPPPPRTGTHATPDPQLRAKIDALLTEEQRAKLDAYCAKKMR